jgi:hypothetical protein
LSFITKNVITIFYIKSRKMLSKLRIQEPLGNILFPDNLDFLACSIIFNAQFYCFWSIEAWYILNVVKGVMNEDCHVLFFCKWNVPHNFASVFLCKCNKNNTLFIYIIILSVMFQVGDLCHINEKITYITLVNLEKNTILKDLFKCLG